MAITWSLGSGVHCDRQTVASDQLEVAEWGGDAHYVMPCKEAGSHVDHVSKQQESKLDGPGPPSTVRSHGAGGVGDLLKSRPRPRYISSLSLPFGKARPGTYPLPLPSLPTSRSMSTSSEVSIVLAGILSHLSSLGSGTLLQAGWEGPQKLGRSRVLMRSARVPGKI